MRDLPPDPSHTPFLAQIREARTRRDERMHEALAPLQRQAKRIRLRLHALWLGSFLLVAIGAALALRGALRPPPPVPESRNAILRWAAERQMWTFLTQLTARDWQEMLKHDFTTQSTPDGPTEYLSFEQQLSLFRRRFAEETEKSPLKSPTSDLKKFANPNLWRHKFQCSIDLYRCPATSYQPVNGDYRPGFISAVSIGASVILGNCDTLSAFLDHLESQNAWRSPEIDNLAIERRQAATCFIEQREWNKAIKEARKVLCLSDFRTAEAYSVLQDAARGLGDPALARMSARCAEESAEYVYSKQGSSLGILGEISAILDIGSAGVLHCRVGDLERAKYLTERSLALLNQFEKINPMESTVSRFIRINESMLIGNLIYLHTALLGPKATIITLLSKQRSASSITESKLFRIDIVESIWRIRQREFAAAESITSQARERYASMAEYINQNASFDELRIGIAQDRRPGVEELNRQALELVAVLEGQHSERNLARIDSVLAWLRAQLRSEGKQP